MSDKKQEPLLDGKLQLGAGEVTPAVIKALEDLIAYARSRVLAPNGTPSIAVHEHRKAFRRARSLIRMLRPVLSNRARRQIDKALRAAHHQYASRRDEDARATAWKVFAARHGFSVPLADEAFEPSRPDGAGRKLSPPHRKPIDDAIALLAERLPPQMSSDDLRRGLEATYRSARGQLRRVVKVADPAHVHQLRRRCKDLCNQLELVESIEPKPAGKWRKRFAAIAQELGDITDLGLVRDGLDDVWRSHPELGPVLKRDIDRAIDADIATQLASTLEDAETFLSRKPRKFGDRFGL